MTNTNTATATATPDRIVLMRISVSDLGPNARRAVHELIGEAPQGVFSCVEGDIEIYSVMIAKEWLERLRRDVIAQYLLTLMGIEIASSSVEAILLELETGPRTSPLTARRDTLASAIEQIFS